jgi:hypothetical protein
MEERRHNMGLTESERVLGEICKRAFLSMWMYQNPYNDRKQGKNGCGKELCDALLVFENDIVIFSVKDCSTTSSHNHNLDWSRWVRKAIIASARQACGATRWLELFPDRIFLDSRCTCVFPIDLPRGTYTRIHRVVVALGGLEIVQRGLSRDNVIFVHTKLDHAVIERTKSQHPLGLIGDVDSSKPFCHVFDESSILAVLAELDTAKDFIEYLVEREKLFRATPSYVVAEGELSLLADYVSTTGENDEHVFTTHAEADVVLHTSDSWLTVSMSDMYIKKREANELSYFWDDLIERITEHVSHGTAFFSSTNDIFSHERALRRVARYRRFERREYAIALFEVLKAAPIDRITSRHVFTLDKTFLMTFVAVPFGNQQSYEDYRRFRREYLAVLSYAMLHDEPNVREVIGIAMSPLSDQYDTSEDMIFINRESMTDDDHEYSIKCSAILNRDKTKPLKYVSRNEYPESN